MQKLLFIGLFFLVACSEELTTGPTFIDPTPNETEFRVYNNTNMQLDSIYINTSGGSHNYSSLGPQSFSSYYTFDFAYPIFELRFKVNAIKFSVVPVDYTGETKLDPGSYSVLISNVDTSNKTFTFIRRKED